MAITTNLLTENVDATDLDSYATASITPAGNELILIAVNSFISEGSPAVPAVSGNGLTWVEVATSGVNDNRRLTVFRALGASPSTGVVTIDFSAVTQQDCKWIISEFANVDTGGSNGANAVVQAVVGSVSTSPHSATLAAFGDAGNATFGAVTINSNNTITPGTGFAEIAERLFNGVVQQQWRNDNDTTVDATTAAGNGIVIALELKFLAAATKATGAHSKMGFMF